MVDLRAPAFCGGLLASNSAGGPATGCYVQSARGDLDIMAKQTWYDKGFEEGLADMPADPPMHAQHASYRNYMDGYRDGERQLQRNVAMEEAQ